MSRGRPKKTDTLTNLWVVEQYYHGDDLTQSWGKPIEICHSEQKAKDRIKLEAALYAADIESPEIDDSLSRMITVKTKGASLYPAMDFWYYHCVLIEED